MLPNWVWARFARPQKPSRCMKASFCSVVVLPVAYCKCNLEYSRQRLLQISNLDYFIVTMKFMDLLLWLQRFSKHHLKFFPTKFGS